MTAAEFSGTNTELSEIRFFYRSLSPATEICPNGYNTVVTARCDPRHSEEPEVGVMYQILQSIQSLMRRFCSFVLGSFTS